VPTPEASARARLLALYTASHAAGQDDVGEAEFEALCDLLFPSTGPVGGAVIPPNDLKKLQATLSSRNAVVTDFNPIITACTGCNTACMLLGNTVQARNAIFYLVKYLHKGGTSLVESLPLYVEALRRVERYPSVAEDAGTAERKGRYFLTTLLNKLSGAIEVSGQLASAALLGVRSEWCSSEARYLYASAAIEYAISRWDHGVQEQGTNRGREDVAAPGMGVDGASPGINLEDNTPTAALTNRDELDPFSTHAKAMARAGKGLGSATPYITIGNNGLPTKVFVSQIEHYARRGEALAKVSLYEYVTLYIVVKKPTVVSGSSKIAYFPFQRDHPLAKTHVQRIRPNGAVAVLSGRCPPAPPHGAFTG